MSTYPPPGGEFPGGTAPYGQPQQPAPYQDQQPYGHQPYTQQPYAEQQYADAQYVDPQYVDPNAAWAGYQQPMPPPKSRNGLKIGLSIGAALIVVVGSAVGYLVFKTVGNTGEYKLAMPASFQGLTQQTNNSLITAMSGTSKDLAQAGGTPVITSYAKASTDKVPQFVVIGAYGNMPLAATQLGQAWTGMTTSGATITGKTDEDAGALGGSMQCAVASQQGAAFAVCVWADNSSYALIMDTSKLQSTTADLPALADRTRQLRAVAEVKK